MNALKEYLVLKDLSNEERYSYLKLYLSEISDPIGFFTEFAKVIKVITVLEAEERAVRVNEQYRVFDEIRSKWRTKMSIHKDRRKKQATAGDSADLKEARIISLFPEKTKHK